MDELLARAFSAYFREAKRMGIEYDQPAELSSGVCHDSEGRKYVRLQNGQRELAVYRVRNDGMLKRLKRWPSALID